VIRSPFGPRNQTSIVRAKGEAVEIMLYDEVGFFGITAKQFASALAEIEADEIHLRVNSPGGDVFDGVAMYNALRQHPAHVVTHIDGLAASIASVIALAGDEVRMAPNAFFMIHNPWGVTVGDADIHRKMADTLDKIAMGSIISTYQAKTGLDVETIETWMDDETWFSAEQAAEAGFVDVVDDPAPVEARALPFDLSIYQHVPAGLVFESPDVLSGEECRALETAFRDEGLSRTEAKKRVSLLKDDLRKLFQREADTVASPPPLRDEVRADSRALAVVEALTRTIENDSRRLEHVGHVNGRPYQGDREPR
jgi:ATP-dependent Clp endopeptidase proteolytic subunit ClpP